jgi:hypothetical protein
MSAEEGAVTEVNQEQQCLHGTITIVMIPAETIGPSWLRPYSGDLSIYKAGHQDANSPPPPETAVT